MGKGRDRILSLEEVGRDFDIELKCDKPKFLKLDGNGAAINYHSFPHEERIRTPNFLLEDNIKELYI